MPGDIRQGAAQASRAPRRRKGRLACMWGAEGQRSKWVRHGPPDRDGLHIVSLPTAPSTAHQLWRNPGQSRMPPHRHRPQWYRPHSWPRRTSQDHIQMKAQPTELQVAGRDPLCHLHPAADPKVKPGISTACRSCLSFNHSFTHLLT